MISRQLIVDLLLRDVVGVALNPVCRLHRVNPETPGPKTSGLRPPRDGPPSLSATAPSIPADLAFMASGFSDIGERALLQVLASVMS